MVLNAPVSTIPSIVGSKGVTLKQIRDATGVKIDIPRRDSLAPNGNANGHAQPASGTATPLQNANADEEEEPVVPITITGPQSSVQEAQARLNEIIATKRSRSTQRVRDIAAHVLPFLLPRRSTFEAAAAGGDIALTLNAPAREITINGEREAVGRVFESIKSAIDYFSAEVTPLKVPLPKSQHRLFTQKAIDEIMQKAKCAVIVPKPEDASDDVVIWGKRADLGAGVQAAMSTSTSAYIHEFPLPGPVASSRQVITYMTHVNYTKTLSAAHPGVSVYLPSTAIIEKASALTVDLVGEKPAVDAAVRQVSELIGKLFGATKEVPIDWLLHRIINSPKNFKKYVCLFRLSEILSSDHALE